MTAFNRLTDAFDDSKNQTGNKESNNTADMIKRSKAIIRAVDKLKSQGIQITKKAELDYILAARYLERHHIELDPQDDYENPMETEYNQLEEPPAAPIKRTPQNNPKEFEIALAHSRKFTAEVEELLKRGQTLPQKIMDEYQLCKTFLKKFT